MDSPRNVDLALGVTAYAIFSKLKNLGAVKVIENCIPEPIPGMENPAVLEKASNEFLRTPTAGAAEAMSNLTGCAMQSPDNKSLNCAGDSCYNMAKSLADEIGRNVSGAASAVSPDWDSATTTLSNAARDYAQQGPSMTNAHTKILETGAQIPYAEIALFAACALIAGLCIGYLIKKKNRIL